MKRRRQKRN